jgi:hypothetical protein
MALHILKNREFGRTCGAILAVNHHNALYTNGDIIFIRLVTLSSMVTLESITDSERFDTNIAAV